MPSTNVATAFASMQWCIMPEKLEEIRAISDRFENGIKLTDAEIKMAIGGSYHNTSEREAVTGPSVISIVGTLLNRSAAANTSGATTYSRLADKVYAAANDDSVDRIILDIDSPGGTVIGVDTLASAISYAKTKKPVVAVVNDMAASAGYWIASQADKIVVSRSSLVGSISVLMVHRDVSSISDKLGVKTTILTTGPDKALGNQFESLSEEAAKKILARMQATHDLFVVTVAEGRGLDLKAVQALATGRTWNGEEAIEIGLADAFGSVQSVLEDSTFLKAPSTVTQIETINSMPDSPETIETVDISALATQVSKMSTLMEGLIENQSSMAAAQAAERAQDLINPLIVSGAVTVAKGNELIAQATENFSLVKSVLAGMNLEPEASVPFGSVVEPGAGRAPKRNAVEAEVFAQLGILDASGSGVALENVTLPLDNQGVVENSSAAAVYKEDRINPEVKRQLAGWF